MKKFIYLSLLAATPAFADSIEIRYEAKLTSMYYADCNGYSSYGSCNSWTNTNLTSSSFFNGQAVSVGQIFSGRYIYDTNATLSGISSDGFQAIYSNAVKLSGISIGEISLPSELLPSTGTSSLSVVNNRNGYDSLFIQGLFSGADWFAISNFFLMDSRNNMFSSFDIPSSLDYSNLNANSYQFAFLRKSDGDQLQMAGTFTSVRFSPAVPEPTSLALACIGLLLVSPKTQERMKALGYKIRGAGGL